MSQDRCKSGLLPCAKSILSLSDQKDETNRSRKLSVYRLFRHHPSGRMLHLPGRARTDICLSPAALWPCYPSTLRRHLALCWRWQLPSMSPEILLSAKATNYKCGGSAVYGSWTKSAACGSPFSSSGPDGESLAQEEVIWEPGAVPRFPWWGMTLCLDGRD